MTLLPGLEDQLSAAARRTDPSVRLDAAPTAAARRRRPLRPRRGGHLGLWTVVGVLLFSGGAYAARGLWTPVLGSAEHGRLEATPAAPPQDQLSVLGVLRRPQTEADRSVASTAALTKLVPSDGQVRTGYVRRLGTLPNGAVAVLVPVDRRRAEDVEDRKVPAQLCLMVVPDRGSEVDTTCGDTSTLLSGGMWIQTKDPLTAKQTAARDRWIEQGQRSGALPTSGRISERSSRELRRIIASAGPPQRSYVVQLVPDVVRRAERFDLPGKPTSPISSNVFLQEAGADAWVTWLDGENRRLSADGSRVEPSALVPPVDSP